MDKSDRAYNNGMGGAPNHRYMTSQTDVDTMVSQGWVSEGVAMCAPSGSNSGGTSTIFTLMTNPTDGQILSAKGSDGTTVKYYGDRDANGIPLSIDRIQVVAANGKTTLVELDSAKQPAKMRSSDGVVFNLTYNGKLAVVTAASPDGATNVNTTFTLPQNAVPTNVSAMLNASLINGSGADSLPLIARYAPAQALTSGASDWVISVNKCGVGVTDAEVTYNIWVPGGVNPVGNMTKWAKSNGGGNYVASIPTGLKPSLTNQQIVEAAGNIEGYLNNICDALGQASHPEAWLAGMCPAIGIYLTTVTGPGGVAIGTACSVISTAVTAYCATAGMSGPPGTDSLAKKIINGLSDPSLYNAQNISLEAWADEKGGGSIYTGRFDVPANGPYPTTAITFPEDYAGYCDSLLDGTWSGTWNIVGTGGNGCNYTDGGDIAITLKQYGSIYTGSVNSAAGIHFLYNPPGTAAHPACSLAHTETSSGGTASAKRTGDSVNLAISLPLSNGNTQKYTGTLTLSNKNNTLSGRITSSWSAGSITLTKK